MDKIPLQAVLDLLENVSRRPSMFVHPLKIKSVENFLTGLHLGSTLGGRTYSRELYKQAAASRGWKHQATGIVWHMKERQLPDETIIQELLAVEAEAYRLGAALEAESTP